MSFNLVARCEDVCDTARHAHSAYLPGIDGGQARRAVPGALMRSMRLSHWHNHARKQLPRLHKSIWT
jgi:hypothetical protein